MAWPHKTGARLDGGVGQFVKHLEGTGGNVAAPWPLIASMPLPRAHEHVLSTAHKRIDPTILNHEYNAYPVPRPGRPGNLVTMV